MFLNIKLLFDIINILEDIIFCKDLNYVNMCWIFWLEMLWGNFRECNDISMYIVLFG